MIHSKFSIKIDEENESVDVYIFRNNKNQRYSFQFNEELRLILPLREGHWNYDGFNAFKLVCKHIGSRIIDFKYYIEKELRLTDKTDAI